MYKCEHFKLEELVGQGMFEAYGDRCWWLLDDRLLRMADELRFVFGEMYINTWALPGAQKKVGLRTQSGLRTPADSTYSILSQHAHGRAFDAVFKEFDAGYVRRSILENPVRFKFITELELDVDWLHFGTRNHFNEDDKQNIFAFSPCDPDPEPKPSNGELDA